MRISDWSSDVCSSDLVDVRELGQQIGKAGEKPTVRERRRHLNSDDFQSGALLAAQPDIARGSAQPAYALSYGAGIFRSEEHTSELQSLMRISYAVFCLKKKTYNEYQPHHLIKTQLSNR